MVRSFIPRTNFFKYDLCSQRLIPIVTFVILVSISFNHLIVVAAVEAADSQTRTTRTTPMYDFSIGIKKDADTIEPEGCMFYPVEIRNKGAREDTYIFDISGALHNWAVKLYDETQQYEVIRITVSAKSCKILYLYVGVAQDGTAKLYINGTSTHSTTVKSSDVLTISVEKDPIYLRCYDNTHYIEYDMHTVFSIMIINNHEFDYTVTLTIIGSVKCSDTPETDDWTAT